MVKIIDFLELWFSNRWDVRKRILKALAERRRENPDAYPELALDHWEICKRANVLPGTFYATLIELEKDRLISYRWYPNYQAEGRRMHYYATVEGMRSVK